MFLLYGNTIRQQHRFEDSLTFTRQISNSNKTWSDHTQNRKSKRVKLIIFIRSYAKLELKLWYWNQTRRIWRGEAVSFSLIYWLVLRLPSVKALEIFTKKAFHSITLACFWIPKLHKAIKVSLRFIELPGPKLFSIQRPSSALFEWISKLSSLSLYFTWLVTILLEFKSTVK